MLTSPRAGDSRREREPGLRLGGRVALVTGAGSGIGGACATRFTEAGAFVWVTDVNEDAASSTAAELTSGGHSCRGAALYVSDEEAWIRMLDEVIRESGPLDVL